MIRHLLAWLLFCFAGCNACGQSKEYKKLVSELKLLSGYYDGLSPFGNVAFRDFGLTREDVKDIDDYIFSERLDSIEQHKLIEFYQNKMVGKLKEALHHKDFIKYGIEDLYGIDVVKSADSRLYNFTFDEKTGGSYRSRISVMHYIPEKAYKDSIAYDVFASDGYNAITPLKAKNGTKYLLEGSVTGCGTCLGSYIQLIHFENGKFVEDFRYDLYIRMTGDGSFTMDYDPAGQTITIKYTTDDLTPSCNCADDDNVWPEDETVPLECYCLFKFNGDTFELVEKTSHPSRK